MNYLSHLIVYKFSRERKHVFSLEFYKLSESVRPHVLKYTDHFFSVIQSSVITFIYADRN